MNRLVFSKSLSNSNYLLRNYSIKPMTQNIKFIPKEPARVIHKPIIYQFTSNCLKQFYRSQSTYAPININTSNLAKDVIVFKYNNPRHFKLMNIFGIAQFFFWLICAESMVANLKNVPVKQDEVNLKNLPFYLKVNLGENKWKYGLSCLCFFFGMASLAFVWVFTLRSVRYLILLKGGTKVSFVTYGPFGTNYIINVPLNCITAVQARNMSTGALPIKVQNKKFYYLLDNRGEYTNPELFDHVINVKRRIKT